MAARHVIRLISAGADFCGEPLTGIKVVESDLAIGAGHPVEGVLPKLAQAATGISAPNRTHRCKEKILLVNIHSIVFVSILLMSRKFDFFPEKSNDDVMTQRPTPWRSDQFACFFEPKGLSPGSSPTNVPVRLVRMRSPTRL
jgi:hypothetical protein